MMRGIESWIRSPQAPLPVRTAAIGGVAAAVAAGVAMALLRWTLLVRTVPERVMEWVLLFVPLDLSEAGLLRLGFDAKSYALYAAIGGTIVLLAALGTLVLQRRWSTRAIVALGLGTWLFAMLVILPLTGAGVFATALLDGTRANVGGYLVVALVYAGVLAAASTLLEGEPTPATSRTTEWASAPSRRTALLMLGSALTSYVATLAVVRLGPRTPFQQVIVLDPQQPVPSGGVDPAHPHPEGVGASPPVASQPVAAAGPYEPPPARPLRRDQDGAVLPSGRRPGELAAQITSNDDFYIVTKNAGGDPAPNPVQWRLVIDGEVGRTIQIEYMSLRNLPAVEVTKTLECISNFVAQCELAPFGCDLISTARWRGVRLSDLLELAGGVRAGVVSLAVIGADEFTTALPIDVALDPDTLLVYEMNGEVLPREHGYPARILVPGRYGMKNAKWVVALRAMSREFVDWYGQRNWSRQAIVKTMTRIDYPAPGAVLPPGEHRIAGIAYAGDRGVAMVEFSADGGATWTVADLLEPPLGRDTWVRWQGHFRLPDRANLTLMARSTDGTGALQIEAFSLPQPDGGSGWFSLDVRAPGA
jgi:DMSO/TMAO reductase YedYZ molybdopterin-dependent catalytic subunit